MNTGKQDLPAAMRAARQIAELFSMLGVLLLPVWTLLTGIRLLRDGAAQEPPIPIGEVQ